MLYRYFVLASFLVCSSSVFAGAFQTRCSGEGCDILQRIRGVADGAYAIGKDNNTLSVAFVGTKTLQTLNGQTLKSFLPYQEDTDEADKLRFQVAKDCVFFAQGAYGSHLPRYSATNLTEPFYPAQEIDFHQLSASSFWQNLRRIENILQSENGGVRLQYTWIREVPAVADFPAHYEMLAAPCALAVSWIKTSGQQVIQKHMILRGGVTD